MINDDLIKYIDTQKSRGISREGIFKKLSDAGWMANDINEGLDKIFPINTPPVIQTPVTPSFSPISSKPKQEDLIPNLMPKVSGPAGALPINSMPAISPLSNSFDSFKPAPRVENTPSVNVMSPGPLPQGAVTSSFRKDYQNTATYERSPLPTHWGRFFLILILILLLAGGGVIFAGVKGYINLPFEIPFFKPTPEQAIMKMANNLSKIETAHYGTNINLVLVNETTSTNQNDISQEPTKNKDEFNISLNAETDIDNTSPQTPKYSTNVEFKVSPSVMGFDGLNLAFIFINDSLYAQIPNIEAIKEYTGNTKWIKLQKTDLEDPNLTNAANNLSPMPVKYDPEKQKQIIALFNEFKFIDSVNEVGIEDVGSGPAYHYQAIISKEKIKNFVSKSIDVVDNPDLSLQRQEILDSVDKIKEVKVDLWVSKGSFMLNKIVLEFPYETTTSFSNIESTTKANIKFTQIISKINEPVTIEQPNDSKSVKDLMTEYESNPLVKDSKIKSIMNNYRAEAALFFETHTGSYGKPNSVGSCTNPVQGSVFADSNTIKSLMELSTGIGSCYSTSKAYAISVPLASDPATRICIDSTGKIKETKTPLISTVCK